ncbi:hypothetical protein BU24DRAFT_423788 [Aaosphaeria arxii CBS 175.79]|uniref:Uncharacterized protein n=1 Tax=Aaosphaeria arxii CBS 175.79 TaxID=1450172 RepID=A0A6A5XQ56_9PLEO|nr:uncharacterized protein BU24DRAFT_423788 [Aaosphaeria arxii CBS 175.79]KAF2014891.1 hypothetical protein BU24DRAFT_423788 [Aaosphaeria arxii CBS 175.79]
MGNSQSAARVVAPLSFLYDFSAQQYGMFSKPNMLDVHNRNLAAFSPYPYFIAGFFFPQQIFQLVWLWKLWKSDGTPQENETMGRFAWVYSLGNVCIGTWMFFWNSNDLKTSNVFVIINTVAQLAYISTQLPPLDTSSTPNVLTHIVSKTFAGIGVLDLLHNTSAAYYRNVPPSSLVQIATGLGFAAAAGVSDWIFGGCLVYDLVALSVGQEGSWGRLLGGYAALTAGIVGLRNWLYPRYKKSQNKSREGYARINPGEE